MNDTARVIDDGLATLPPLAVDLDGTLIRSDTFHEGLISLAKTTPMALLQVVRMLRVGKAAVKHAVASATASSFDPALLPYNQALLAYIRQHHAAGRRVGLFTAADQSIADAVARHLGCFDVAVGSSAVHNLSGAAKAAVIQDVFGGSFVYAGDAAVDTPIFDQAAAVILAGPDVPGLLSRNHARPIEAQFPVEPPTAMAWFKAFRLQHWSKNILVFVAPFLAMQTTALVKALVLFVLMGILASATYLVNDLADLAADRVHPRKRLRPFAAGTIPVGHGVVVATALIAVSMLASMLSLPIGCSFVLLCYLGLTLLYSAFLKRLAMIDVTVLACLFTLRVLAGSMVVSAPLSPWLLTFALLFFLGLAAIKRYAELHRVVTTIGEHGSARGYSRQDIPILLATGVATGVSAVVIFMIYLINEQYPQRSYAHPDALWGIMPVLLVWTLRLWHLAVHGRMSEDPVVFALKDRFSLGAGAVILAILAVARF